MGIFKEVVTSSLAESAIFVLVDSALSFILLIVFGFEFLSSLGLILLVESAVLMLIGGALDFSKSASGRKILSLMKIDMKDEKDESGKAGKRAGIFTLTGVILFLISLLLALLFY